MNKEINVDEVLTTIDTSIQELKDGIQPDLLSKADKTEIKSSLSRVIRLAIKVKLEYQQQRIKDLILTLESDETIDIDKMKNISDKVEKALDLEAA